MYILNLNNEQRCKYTEFLLNNAFDNDLST